MASKNMLLAAALAALSGVNALPQGGSGGSGPSFYVIAQEYTTGGCTGISTTVAVPGNDTCYNLPTAATSAKVVDYEVDGCQADFFTTLDCTGDDTSGTYGELNKCEQVNSPFLSVYVLCPSA